MMIYFYLLLFFVILTTVAFHKRDTLQLQYGGATVNNNSSSDYLLSQLKDDREKWFKFRKQTFPSLDDFRQSYEDKVLAIQNKRQKMQEIVDDYEKTDMFLEGIGKNNTIKPMYTRRDIARKDKELRETDDLYNQYLNYFLELQDLNQRLLVLRSYSKIDNSQEVEKLSTRYQKIRQKLGQIHRQFTLNK